MTLRNWKQAAKANKVNRQQRTNSSTTPYSQLQAPLQSFGITKGRSSRSVSVPENTSSTSNTNISNNNVNTKEDHISNTNNSINSEEIVKSLSPFLSFLNEDSTNIGVQAVKAEYVITEPLLLPPPPSMHVNTAATSCGESIASSHGDYERSSFSHIQCMQPYFPPFELYSHLPLLLNEYIEKFERITHTLLLEEDIEDIKQDDRQEHDRMNPDSLGQDPCPGLPSDLSNFSPLDCITNPTGSVYIFPSTTPTAIDRAICHHRTLTLLSSLHIQWQNNVTNTLQNTQNMHHIHTGNSTNIGNMNNNSMHQNTGLNPSSLNNMKSLQPCYSYLPELTQLTSSSPEWKYISVSSTPMLLVLIDEAEDAIRMSFEASAYNCPTKPKLVYTHTMPLYVKASLQLENSNMDVELTSSSLLLDVSFLEAFHTGISSKHNINTEKSGSRIIANHLALMKYSIAHGVLSSATTHSNMTPATLVLMPIGTGAASIRELAFFGIDGYSISGGAEQRLGAELVKRFKRKNVANYKTQKTTMQYLVYITNDRIYHWYTHVYNWMYLYVYESLPSVSMVLRALYTPQRNRPLTEQEKKVQNTTPDMFECTSYTKMLKNAQQDISTQNGNKKQSNDTHTSQSIMYDYVLDLLNSMFVTYYSDQEEASSSQLLTAKVCRIFVIWRRVIVWTQLLLIVLASLTLMVERSTVHPPYTHQAYAAPSTYIQQPTQEQQYYVMDKHTDTQLPHEQLWKQKWDSLYLSTEGQVTSLPNIPLSIMRKILQGRSGTQKP